MSSSSQTHLGGTAADVINFMDLKHREAETHFYTLERTCWRLNLTQKREKHKQEKKQKIPDKQFEPRNPASSWYFT